MFKHSRKTDVPYDGAKSSDSEGKGSWFKTNQRSIIAVGLIVIMAFIMRFVFAYGVSADSAFALSGGAVASEHLHTITQILNGGSFFGVDDTLSYPFGSVNSNPVLIDSILAGIAMIGTSLGMSTVKAASLTLATFSLVCGTFAVIPMFFLGKEVIGTRKAGFVAALFLAFCPIVITQTVFSNGTETGWILLLFIVLSLLMFKGIKEITVSSRTDDPFKEVIAVNKSALRLAAFSGLVLALIVLSTNVFRPIIVMMIIAMAIMTVVGRFMYRDTRPVVLFFSIIILIGVAVGAAYYIPAQLWDQVLSGVLITSLVAIALCLTFSLLQRKPWVVTVPVYLIGVIVALVLMYFFASEYYELIVNGNTIYAACIAPLTTGTLSISYLSTAFGVVTMWFTMFVIGVLIWKIPKNISSFRYQFLVIFMFFCAYMTFKSEQMATIFSPVFALGFAYIVMWLFDHVDFKTYFMMIKNAGWKNAWKKVLKPIPFATILIIAGLLCVPIGMYAIDASISNNEKNDFEGLDLGAIGYYVKTDDDWTVGSVLKSYADVDKTGALVTWVDYANDAATMGKFKVIVDAEGNGAEAVSNILLSNAIDGSSDAAMLIYLVTYKGLTDEVKAALAMSDEDYAVFEKIINDPSQFREAVITDTTKYGIFESDISDDNVRYVYGTEFLTEKYSGYRISNMYSAVAAISGDISYFMVDGSMFPMYYGYSSMFSTMAYANDYVISDNYGTVDQFLTTGYVYYTGLYEYTDAMFSTLLWRAYIGMSPQEAGFSMAYQYFQYLMLSDGTYKAHPGYGLSNYTVDYDHWYVMYNPDDDATVSSDGWVKKLYTEAIAEQSANGGLINYLSGLPVFMKYVPNDTGKLLSGQVTNAAGENVKGVRVSVVDSEGTVRSTAYTDEDGKYDILVTGDNPKIKYYTGSQNLNDGSLIKTVDYTDGVSGDLVLAFTTGSGKFVDSKDNDVGKMIYDAAAVMTLKGKTTGASCTATVYKTGTPPDEEYGFEWDAAAKVVPDVYTVSLTAGDISYVTDVTITVNPGSNEGIKVTVSAYKVTLNITDDSGAPRGSGGYVKLKDLVSGYETGEITIADGGIAETTLIPGTYVIEYSGVEYISASSPITVSESMTQTVKAYWAETTKNQFTGFPENRMATVYSSGFQTAVMSDGTGKVTAQIPKGNGPLSFTAYMVSGETAYMAKSDHLAAETGSIKISGTMKNSSSEAVSGTIIFYSDDGYQIPVSVNSEGAYSVILKEGWHTVYANSGTEVSIFRLNVTAAAEQNIDLQKGSSISGYTYWASSSYQMPFVPILVNTISGCDDCSFTLVSDSKGAYSFYVPSEATCSLTATCADPFYYGDVETNRVKTETGVSSSANFTASVPKMTLRNDTPYAVKVSDKKINGGGTESDPMDHKTATVTVAIEEDGVYASEVYSTPADVNDFVIPSDFFDDSIMYYALKLTGLESTDKVTIEALDDGLKIDKTTSGSTRKYFLQSGKEFMVTVTNSDSNKVMYYRTNAVTAAETKAVVLSDAATVSGYVGISKSGTLTATISATDYDFTISSGRYSVLLPIDKGAITLTATIEEEESDYTYRYEKSVIIPESSMEAGKEYVYNMAVVSNDIASGTNEITADLIVTGMTADSTAEVTFSFTPVDGRIENPETTFTLSGGSSWLNVAFYDDDTYANEISTMTFGSTTAAYTVYGKGTILKDKVGYMDDNLTVILTDINGNTVCTAKIDGGVWSNTTPTKETTKVNVTTNSIGDSEYMYAVEIVNDDNFTKKIKFSDLTGVDTTKWTVTYVNDRKIVDDGIVEVKGHTTVILYVKITNIVTSPTEEDLRLPADGIQVKVTVTDKDDNPIVISSDSSSESVIIDEGSNIATVKSSTSDSTVTIDSNGASGRDVIDSKSEMPVYVWVLIALAVALLFIIIWAASKRGVFSRRK